MHNVGLRRDALAAFIPTTLHGVATRAGTHAGSKTHLALPAAYIWLVGSLHCELLGGDFLKWRIGYGPRAICAKREVLFRDLARVRENKITVAKNLASHSDWTFRANPVSPQVQHSLIFRPILDLILF